MEKRIKVILGDITKLEVDAIVNAANSSLEGGGGVDGAIHRAAGPGLVNACRRVGNGSLRCLTGDVVITPGFDLLSRFVIHTVGPVWHGGIEGEAKLLKKCYENSILMMLKHGLRTIAFPSISTGAYGYPIEKAAQIAYDTVFDQLSVHSTIEEVYFVCYNELDYKVYKKLEIDHRSL